MAFIVGWIDMVFRTRRKWHNQQSIMSWHVNIHSSFIRDNYLLYCEGSQACATVLNIETEWRIYVSVQCKLTTIGSDNGLSPGRHQAIIWTKAGVSIIWPLRTNLREILIEIRCRSSCLGLNVLMIQHDRHLLWCLFYGLAYNTSVVIGVRIYLFLLL